MKHILIFLFCFLCFCSTAQMKEQNKPFVLKNHEYANPKYSISTMEKDIDTYTHLINQIQNYKLNEVFGINHFQSPLGLNKDSLGLNNKYGDYLHYKFFKCDPNDTTRYFFVLENKGGLRKNIKGILNVFPNTEKESIKIFSPIIQKILFNKKYNHYQKSNQNYFVEEYIVYGFLNNNLISRRMLTF